MLMLVTNSSRLLHVLRYCILNQRVKSCFTWSRHLYKPSDSMKSSFWFNDKSIYSKIIVTFSFTRRPRSFSLGVLKKIITIKIQWFKPVLIIYLHKAKKISSYRSAAPCCLENLVLVSECFGLCRQKFQK